MKKLLAIVLAFLMLTPCCVFAQTPEEADTVISDADYAAVDLMWQTLGAAEERVLRSAANAATAQAVATAVLRNDLYVEGTLRWNGEDNFTFETVVGVTCGYSARLRNLALQAEADEEALAEAELQTVSYAAANAPKGKDVYLIEPYYGLDSSFTKQYQTEAQNIAKATGGTYTCYTKTEATIDAVADAVESGAVVIFDSHGDTDYAKGEDYTTGATTSYLLLQTGSGLTTADYAKDGETYHAVNYGSYGKMKYYAVDGTCIANHMDAEAPNSLIWMAICLGMATDGLEKPMLEKGVGVVYGYSQSVTFDYDYLWEECFWDEMIAGETVASAIATMKEKVGKWDYCSEYTTIAQARRNDAAFPIVASAEDTYPGHGNVDDLQTVYSTWTLYAEEKPCAHSSLETVTAAATCTEDGYVRIVCKDCGETVSEATVNKLGHDYGVTTVAPTCTEKGYDRYVCDRCGDAFDENYTDALGHSFVDGVCESCGEKDPDFEPPFENPFSDVREGDWYYAYVMTAAEAELINGYRDGTFLPTKALTRAEAATLLYRLSGSPEVDGSASFTDLPNEWYRDAIAWAEQSGVVTGFPDGTFRPDELVTREQFVTMLWRLKGEPQASAEAEGFEDIDCVSGYARTAFAWAVENGIVNGTTSHDKEGTYLAPQDNIKRCEVAKILCVCIDLI